MPLPWPTLSCHAQLYPAQLPICPATLAMHLLALPCVALPCPAQPLPHPLAICPVHLSQHVPALLCPPYPALSLPLPYPTIVLPCPAVPCPTITLPCPLAICPNHLALHLPCPTQPCNALALPNLTMPNCPYVLPSCPAVASAGITGMSVTNLCPLPMYRSCTLSACKHAHWGFVDAQNACNTRRTTQYSKIAAFCSLLHCC